MADGDSYRFSSVSATDSRGIMREPSYNGVDLAMFDEASTRRYYQDAEWKRGGTHLTIEASPASIQVQVVPEDEDIEELASAAQSLVAALQGPQRVAAFLPPFKVFIGHGGDRYWVAVRDSIESEHEVVAFEFDDRVARALLEVVAHMISESSVAVIVMTGSIGWKMVVYLRQNVVHELGFAHG